MTAAVVSLALLAYFAWLLGCFHRAPLRPDLDPPERFRARPVKRAGKW